MSKVLVLGATGGTGRLVVQILLEKNLDVIAVVRDQKRLFQLLRGGSDDSDGDGTHASDVDRIAPAKGGNHIDHLVVKEASIADMTLDEMKDLTRDCCAIVSCLGHNRDLRGLYGRPWRLVADAARLVTRAMPPNAKFVLLAGEGICHPDGKTDPVGMLGDRAAMSIVRIFMPPFNDMDEAVQHLHETRTVPWVVVRPTNLVDDESHVTGNYDTFECQQGDLFGNHCISRTNVADFIANLVLDESQWDRYQHKMPVIRGKCATG